jgi:hypothetical protein
MEKVVVATTKADAQTAGWQTRRQITPRRVVMVKVVALVEHQPIPAVPLMAVAAILGQRGLAQADHQGQCNDQTKTSRHGDPWKYADMAAPIYP